jgi:two-component system sensor histidine kinase AgrC
MFDQIRSIFSLIFAISFMYMLLDSDFSSKKKLYLSSLFAAVVLICDIVILVNFGYTYFMKLYPYLIQAPVLLMFIFVSTLKLSKVLFVHFTLIAIATSVYMIAVIISSFFGSGKALVNVICYIIYLSLGFIIYRYLRPSFLYMLRNAEKGWIGFCAFPVSYTIILYTVSSYNVDALTIAPKTILNATLLLVLALSAYYLIFRSFRQIREQLTLQNEQNLLRTQIAAAQTHLEALLESQEKTIIYRHDMRHHLNLISAFLEDNNLVATQKYIAEVQNTIEGAVVEQYCNNYTVNLILYSYLAKAKYDQITVETQINLPENNTVSDMDLCVIFANAIENAINACLRISNTADRSLKIVCKNKNDKLFIQITNSFEGTIKFVNDLPVSTEINHGFGTKSIASVVQKYSGICSFSADNNVFKSVFIL